MGIIDSILLGKTNWVNGFSNQDLIKTYQNHKNNSAIGIPIGIASNFLSDSSLTTRNISTPSEVYLITDIFCAIVTYSLRFKCLKSDHDLNKNCDRNTHKTMH